LNLSPINMSGATEIIKGVPINFAATFDPYAIDNNGRRINELNIKKGGGLARLTSARFNTGFSLKSDMFQKGGAKKDPTEEDIVPDYGANPFELDGVNADPHFGRGLDQEEDEEDPKNAMYRNKMPWDA